MKNTVAMCNLKMTLRKPPKKTYMLLNTHFDAKYLNGDTYNTLHTHYKYLYYYVIRTVC